MTPEKPITFAIHTIGCKTNQAESDDIARQLVLRGCHQVEIAAVAATAAGANDVVRSDAASAVAIADANDVSDYSARTAAASIANVAADANDAAVSGTTITGVGAAAVDYTTGTVAADATGANDDSESPIDNENYSYSDANDSGAIDYIIINTCTVTAAADRKTRHLIRKLKSAGPKSKLIITGCFAELNSEPIEGISADYIFSNNKKNEIADFICRKTDEKAELITGPEQTNKELRNVRSRAFVKIQDGCQQGCSYCIVPRARGPYLSTDPAKIIDDIKNLVYHGHDEIVLTGIHVGKFGVDLLSKKTAVKNLPELVLEILKNTPVKRLRLSSIEINEIDESLLGVIRNNGPRLVPHLHIPLQSGSDNILKAMNRKYDSSFFISAIEHIKKAIPDITLTTDVIVGFPGETGQDFTDTVKLVKNINFSKLHVFKYSIRPGTKAAGMAGQVQEKTKTERSRILRELGLDLRNSFVASNIGKKLNVVCEEYDIKSNIAGGTAENYIKVYFDLNFEEYKLKKGKILKVFAKSSYADGLYGEVI